MSLTFLLSRFRYYSPLLNENIEEVLLAPAGTKALRTQIEKQSKDMENDYERKDFKLCFLKFLLLCSLMSLWIQGRLSL